MSPYEATEEQRDELVARKIQLRGLTGPAVHFLEASRPYRALGANECSSSIPCCEACSVATSRRPAGELADDTGIELLIARLEESDDDDHLDA